MGKKKKKNAGSNVVATNRRARHDYTILESFECGIQLVGTEIKAIREGHVSLTDAFAIIEHGEVWLRNLNIPEYSLGTWTNHRPLRHRKLLLHRNEIDSLEGKVRDGNKTLVPLKLYFMDGLLKWSSRSHRASRIMTSARTSSVALRSARSSVSSAAE